MTRIVFCKKYKKDLEGMVTPPYPGDKGQDIFDNVSKQAWDCLLYTSPSPRDRG